MERYRSPMEICGVVSEGDTFREEVDVATAEDVRAVRQEFAARAPEQLRERAALVFDEVVNNALEHGGAPVRVDIIYGVRGIAVGTTQRGPFLSEAAVEALFATNGDPALFQANGRGGGLVLLRSYADGAYASVPNKQLYAVVLGESGKR